MVAGSEHVPLRVDSDRVAYCEEGAEVSVIPDEDARRAVERAQPYPTARRELFDDGVVPSFAFGVGDVVLRERHRVPWADP